uniref:Uncharacterized protein n=1 Tax=Arundo donax TaxID=35708 RepID=A0A0A9A6Q6_ARUDO
MIIKFSCFSCYHYVELPLYILVFT